jgi:hypothetical protein
VWATWKDCLAGAGKAKESATRLAIPASTWLAHFVSHEFEAYVCTECGYLETHVKVPTKVPYEEIEGFRWVNPETPEEGPCR